MSYQKIPISTQIELKRYVVAHKRTGHFLTACLSNDFVSAVCRADDRNLAAIVDIAKFIYNEIPSVCWGSKAKVDAWIEQCHPTTEAPHD